MQVEEYDGVEYKVYPIAERLDAVEEVIKQVTLWGHCESHWVNRLDGVYILISNRLANLGWAGSPDGKA